MKNRKECANHKLVRHILFLDAFDFSKIRKRTTIKTSCLEKMDHEENNAKELKRDNHCVE